MHAVCEADNGVAELVSEVCEANDGVAEAASGVREAGDGVAGAASGVREANDELAERSTVGLPRPATGSVTPTMGCQSFELQES